MKTLRAYSMVIVLVVIAVLFHLLTNGLIFTAMNLTNIILQNSYVVLLILGMLPVILTGNVDLSVGSVLAFVGAIAAILQVNYHCGVLVTLLVSLLVGILIGCWQGMWIAYFDIPAFLVTLSGELVFRGLTQVVLDGASIGPFSDTFRAIASSFIPDLFGGSGFHLTTMILAVLACAVYVYLQLHGRADKQRHGVPVRPITGFIIKCVVMCAVILYLSWQMASYNGYPTVLIIMLVLCLVYSFICSRTIFGRGLYAIGGNRKAAMLSGVKDRLYFFLAYANMGLMSAVAPTGSRRSRASSSWPPSPSTSCRSGKRNKHPVPLLRMHPPRVHAFFLWQLDNGGHSWWGRHKTPGRCFRACRANLA